MNGEYATRYFSSGVLEPKVGVATSENPISRPPHRGVMTGFWNPVTFFGYAPFTGEPSCQPLARSIVRISLKRSRLEKQSHVVKDNFLNWINTQWYLTTCAISIYYPKWYYNLWILKIPFGLYSKPLLVHDLI